MKLPRKLEIKTLLTLMTKKIIQLTAKIKSQVNQKQRKMPPMLPSVQQETPKMPLTMLKIMPKN